MREHLYRVGIDVGLKSVGLACIEVDQEGHPIRILNAQSVIHDGGVDPQSQKTGDSRRAQSGIARRTRRMRKRNLKRRRALDKWLADHGYPLLDNTEVEWFEPWQARADAAECYIEDADERKAALSISIRHMARHRGWRNPYSSISSLMHVQAPESKQYLEMRDNAMAAIDGQVLPELATPAQLVCAVWEYQKEKPVRVRTSTGSSAHKDKLGLIQSRLMQSDNAYELRRILEMQRIPETEIREIIALVFDAKSPKGSAANRVGNDPLDPTQKRALKASLAFQKYRILNMLTNLRIKDESGQRPLDVDEKQHAFEYLCEQTTNDISWGDIAEELGFKRSQLKGVGSATEDGDDRVTSRPPVIVTTQRIAALKNTKLRKKLQEWWLNNDDDAREAMIELLSNSVDIDAVRNELQYAEAINFIEELDDDQLTELDKVDLPNGRAAYSSSTLTKLTHQMLTTTDDLHAARIHVFNIPEDWRPAQPGIGEPIGNPAVDRVLKIVNRYLTNVQKRWGAPLSVQIEHVRGGFNSTKTAREMKREYETMLGNRTKYREHIGRELQAMGIEHILGYDIRRQQAITRQNGQCLYCGKPIDFSSCQMDHIVPRKGVGSTNTQNNLAAVCELCNKEKTNIPFAVWCKTPEAQERGVTLKGAIRRVNGFNIDPLEYKGRAATDFKKAIIRRLKQTEADDPIDNRSIESVAWMADELHRRIDWYFNGKHTLSGDTVSVRVFRGSVTAEARRASGIEGQIHFVGPSRKTRLDRRHHAVDAAVVALMGQKVSQFLTERQNLRSSFLATNEVDPVYGAWKDYPTKSVDGYWLYKQWMRDMDQLLQLLNDALDSDRIQVLYPQRYALGNSIAHNATIHPLTRILLGNSIDADTIRKASTPALYCALTRLPDYSPSEGLPENSEREIQVNGTHVGANDEVTFFTGSAAQIAVQEGSAEIGSAIHHARVYRYWQTMKSGKRKEAYGWIRVFQTDLLRYRNENLFTAPLAPQSVSMRYAEPKVVQAILAGDAEYLGAIMINDEINLQFDKPETGKIGAFLDFSAEDASINPAVACRWLVTGLEQSTKVAIKPLLYSYEGLQNVPDIEPSAESVLKDGWVVAINTVAVHKAKIVHRNALGEKRVQTDSGMPISWSFIREEA